MLLRPPFSLTRTPSHGVAANAELHQVRQHPETVQLRRVRDAVLREAEAHQRRRRRRKAWRQRSQSVVLQPKLSEVVQTTEQRRGAQLTYFVAIEVDLHESAATVKPPQVPDVVTLGGGGGGYCVAVFFRVIMFCHPTIMCSKKIKIKTF